MASQDDQDSGLSDPDAGAAADGDLQGRYAQSRASRLFPCYDPYGPYAENYTAESDRSRSQSQTRSGIQSSGHRSGSPMLAGTEGLQQRNGWRQGRSPSPGQFSGATSSNTGGSLGSRGSRGASPGTGSPANRLSADAGAAAVLLTGQPDYPACGRSCRGCALCAGPSNAGLGAPRGGRRRRRVAQDATSTLPDECLVQIFSKLDLLDKQRSMQVCPRWQRLLCARPALAGRHRLVLNVDHWAAASFGSVWCRSLACPAADWVGLHAHMLSRVVVTGCLGEPHGYGDRPAPEYRAGVKRFLEQVLPGLLGSLSAGALGPGAAAVPVELDFMHLSPFIRPLISCTPEYISNMGANIEALRLLSLDKPLTYHDLILISELSQLKDLQLRARDSWAVLLLHDRLPSSLSKLSMLTRLELSGGIHDVIQGLELLTGLTSLQELTIGGQHAGIGEPLSLSTLTRLTSLTASHRTGNFAAEACMHLPRLRRAELCMQDSESDWQGALAYPTHLTKLKLSDCNLTVSLAEVCEHCTALEDLEWEDCTLPRMPANIARLRRLRRLHLGSPDDATVPAGFFAGFDWQALLTMPSWERVEFGHPYADSDHNVRFQAAALNARWRQLHPHAPRSARLVHVLPEFGEPELVDAGQ